jgi:DNA polymerase III epsilon subunit-like protein
MIVFRNLFLIYDVESTSNKPTEDDIISLGAILCEYKNKKFESLFEYHSYVSTHKRIDPQAQAVHHISQEDIKDAPSLQNMIQDLTNRMKPFISDPKDRVILVAHNGRKFDDLILYCNFISKRIDFEEFLSNIRYYGSLDSLVLLKSIFKHEKDFNKLPKDCKTNRISFALGNCYESFCGGKSLEGAHDALIDSKALLSVLNSECITARININLILDHIEKKEKTLSLIKKSAGLAFKKMEDFYKNERSCDTSSEQISSLMEMEDILSTEPFFHDVKFNHMNYEHLFKNDPQFRLCLNCMTFVSMSQHNTCSV